MGPSTVVASKVGRVQMGHVPITTLNEQGVPPETDRQGALDFIQDTPSVGSWCTSRAGTVGDSNRLKGSLHLNVKG